MKMSCPDEVILSFFDTLVHQRDLDLLKEPNWLNDVVIGFFYEYLGKNIFSEFRSDIAFLDPDLAFACASTDDSVAAEMTKELKLPEKKLVLIPINNNHDATQVGGTHWSLLFYNRSENAFHALDSAGRMNSDVARKTAKNMELALEAGDTPKFVEDDVPQQSNGYDCGIYVLCFSEIIASNLLLHKNASVDQITPEFVKNKRREIHELILYLREIF